MLQTTLLRCGQSANCKCSCFSFARQYFHGHQRIDSQSMKIGTVRFRSGRATKRHKRTDPTSDNQGNDNHSERRKRHRESGKNWKGYSASRLYYYVKPQPPPPPKFDVTVLGTTWTRPSNLASKDQTVKQVLEHGKISQFPSRKFTNGGSCEVSSVQFQNGENAACLPRELGSLN